MTKKKSAKRAFISSFMSFIMCFAMLAGTTFAWYTDSVTSSGNKIIAGTLDIQLWKYDDTLATPAYVDISKSGAPIFQSANLVANNSTNTLWEPGKTQVAYLKLVNVGNLWLKYQVALNVFNVTKNLNEVMWYQIVPNAKPDEENDVDSWNPTDECPAKTAALGVQTVSDAVPMAPMTDNEPVEHYFALVIHMDENAGNEYMAGEIDFDLTVLATQYTQEFDSFNNQYDANAEGFAASGSAVYSTDTATTVTTGSTRSVGNAKVTIPAGTATAGGVALTTGENVNLYVEETDTPANFMVQAGNSTTTYEVGLETDSGAKIVSNGSAFIVELNIGVVDLQQFAHNGEAMTAVANKNELAIGKYYYDQPTGIVTFMTDSFSPFTSEYLFAGGIGTEKYPYLIETDKHWKALADICVNDSTYAATAGKNYTVISDIDVSSYEGVQVNLQYFAGNMDWGWHSIAGFSGMNTKRTDSDGNTAVFNNLSGDVTIKNMNFRTYTLKSNNGTIGNTLGNNVPLQLSNMTRGAGTITFSNINIYGSVINNGTNNGGLLAYGYGSGGKLVVEHVYNYASITTTKGQAAIYIGALGGASAYEFNDCINYGTLNAIGSGAMLIGNPNYGHPTITVENCQNLGTIASNGIDSKNLVIALNNGDRCIYGKLTINGLETANNANATAMESFFTQEAVANAITGNKLLNLSVNTLSTNEGKFVLTPVENAVRYSLSFSFAAANHNGGKAGHMLQFTELPSDGIWVGSWITKSQAIETGEQIIEHNEYGTTYYTCGDNYVFYEDGARFMFDRADVSVAFIAYDANDNVLGIFAYQYAY